MPRFAHTTFVVYFALVLSGLSLMELAVAPTARSGTAQAEDGAQKEKERIAKWLPAITAFEDQDRQSPPPQDAVLFVGSSTIRLWDTQAAFPNLPTINRGFGGSHLADALHYLDRLVLQYKPRIVVLHAGGNDLNAQKTPEAAARDFREIHARIRRELPQTRLLYIGIKPTLARASLRRQEQALNQLIRAELAKDPLGVFIETEQAFSDEHGKPRADLLTDDKLHLNEAGNAVLTSLVRPHLTDGR